MENQETRGNAFFFFLSKVCGNPVPGCNLQYQSVFYN